MVTATEIFSLPLLRSIMLEVKHNLVSRSETPCLPPAAKWEGSSWRGLNHLPLVKMHANE